MLLMKTISFDKKYADNDNLEIKFKVCKKAYCLTFKVVLKLKLTLFLDCLIRQKKLTKIGVVIYTCAFMSLPQTPFNKKKRYFFLKNQKIEKTYKKIYNYFQTYNIKKSLNCIFGNT